MTGKKSNLNLTGTITKKRTLLFVLSLTLLFKVSMVSANNIEIKTDTTWKTQAGNIANFICEPPANFSPEWTHPGYNDSNWTDAVPISILNPSDPLIEPEISPYGPVTDIWHCNYNAYLVNFRKTFTIDQEFNLATISISVDDNFHLYVNGTLVEVSLSDAGNYGPFNIAPYLIVGENTIAVSAWDGYACSIQDRTYRRFAAVIDIEIEEDDPIVVDSCINVSQTLKMNDFSTITNAHVTAGSYFEAGVGSTVFGNVTVNGNAFLRGQPWAPNEIHGDVTLAGTLSQQHSVNLITGTLLENTPVAPITIPSKTVSHGSVDKWELCNETLSPGNYRNVTVRSNCYLILESGEYNVETFMVRPDATIIPGNGDAPVFINAQREFNFGDRAMVDIDSLPYDLIVYTNQNYQVHIGNNSSFIGHIIAPHAKVAVFQSTYNGCVYAKEMETFPNASITGAQALQF